MVKLGQIDFETLRPGDYISPEQLERLFGVKRDMGAYSLKLLGLVSTAMSMRRDLYCDSHKQGFRVLTDEEAVAKGFTNIKSALESIQREHKRQETRIRRENLPDHSRRAHESLVNFSSGLALNAAADKRKLSVFAKLQKLPEGK